MNVMAVAKYQWRRQHKLIYIYIGIMLLSVIITAAALMFSMREVSMTIDQTGRIVNHVSYGAVAFLDDPSRILEPSAFTMLIIILVFVALRRDREFLVSCSVPRYRVLLGSLAFLGIMSVALSVVGGLVAPAILRVALLLFGFPLKGGWSVNTIILGGNARLPLDMLTATMDMMAFAGIYTMLGYIFLRWWKVILVLFGAFVGTIILLVAMVQWQTVVAQIVMNFADWVEWAMEQLIPLIESFFSKENQLVYSTRFLGVGLISMLISYPVMRGMKVI